MQSLARAAVAALLLAAFTSIQCNAADAPLVIAQQGYFFVPGPYTNAKDGPVMTGQMFVQFQIPHERKHKYPVVMWHGGGQTGTNFLDTPEIGRAHV